MSFRKIKDKMEKETVEEYIWSRVFPDEDFDPNDYNDWAKENSREAYKLAIEFINILTQ